MFLKVNCSKAGVIQYRKCADDASHLRLIEARKDMSDSYSEPQNNFKRGEGNRDRSGRGRGYGGRDTGGFRIRLSDNEMRSARAIQEAFNLRSTVAVLGFAIRTLGQMLEEGKLSELIEEQRSQGDRRLDHNQGGGRGRVSDDRNRQTKGSKPNPFARPEKPQPQRQQEEQLEDQDQATENQGKDLQSQSDQEIPSQEDSISKESQENKSISAEEA